MKAKSVSKLLAMILVAVMLVGMLPMSVFAATIDFDPTASGDDYYKLISKKDWELAPGIEETEIVLNNAEGSMRQVVHSVKVDMNNPYTKIIPGYKGMIPTEGNYGTEATSTQAKNAEALGYGNVVAATNAMLSWYNSAYYVQNPHLIGEPLYYNIIDGYYYENSQGAASFSSKNAVVVINYDYHPLTGEKRPEDMPKVLMRSQTDPLTGWEQNAISVWEWLVKPDANGVPKPTYSKNHTSGFESRTFVGITADGEIILSVSDGRQTPYSAGFNMYEMGEYMIKMGCIYAANCDGGGSTTFVSERPGEELKVNCSLSDGGERPTTNTFLVISTASASGTFERATLSTDYDYYTPGSSVTFSALGTDAVGTKVEIPADVEWAIKEEGMGTIANGVFQSNGTAGTVTAQMLYEGKVVGERSITLAMPDQLSFSQPVVTIPVGTKAQIPVKATLSGLYEIGISPDDVTITSENAQLGTVDGLHFVGAAEIPEENSSVLTVTLKTDPTITASTSLKLGEASVVMWDFEGGQEDIDEWNCVVIRNPGEDHRDFYHKLSLATKEDGQVHNGEYSMRLETNGLSSSAVHSQQYAYVRLGLKDQKISLENARSLGFWLYVPEDNIQCWVQGYYKYDTNGDGVPDALAEVNLMNSENVYYNVDESGWHYLSMDLSDFENVDLTYSSPFDADPSDGKTGETDEIFLTIIFHKAINNILWQTNGSINGPFTYYIDNITVDYSEAVEDREAPIFESVVMDNGGIKTNMGKHDVITTKSNLLNIVANVAEATYRTDGTGTKHALYNYTGLNADSAKVYVDGVQVGCTYENGKITLSGVAVADGYHRVKFEIYDNAGNKSTVVRMVNVESGVKSSTVQLVPADPSLVVKDRLNFGSLFWMNLTASNIETVQSVSTVIDLNSVNHWELDHMVVADGFSASYWIDEETNTATITFTRTGASVYTGEAVLAQLPIRIIYFDTDMNIPGYTAQTVWSVYKFWPHDLKVDVDKGVITYVDGYTSSVLNTFSNEKFRVNTEMYTDYQSMGSDPYFIEHGTTHVHTAEALEDKVAGCSAGYTGRTFCAVCNSIVDWGTTLPATGEHTYEMVDGKLTCILGGELFNGTYTDGLTYYDGVAAVNGWVEIDGVQTYYYKDGKMLTGANVIDKMVYTFDKNGVYQPDVEFSGYITCDDGLMYFADRKTYLTGYNSMGAGVPVPTYFDENGIAREGEFIIGGETCLFEEGVFVSCTNPNVLQAGWAGENIDYVLYTDGQMMLTGSGEMFNYSHRAKVPWQAHKDEIKKVFYSKDITATGRFAFTHAYNITEIVFEEGSRIEKVEYESFYYNMKVKTLILPDTVKSIGWRAIGNWQKLETLYLPDGITSIHADTFYRTNTNACVQVAEGTYAHNFVAEKGFANLELRQKKNYPLAVGNCGESIEWKLYDNGQLVITGEGAIPDYSYQVYDDNAAPWALLRSQITSVEIGKDITSIGTYAFYQFANVEEVTFEEGSSLTFIGDGAFGYMKALKSIVLPASLETIDKRAFYFSGLETVAFEENSQLKTIGNYAFRDCTSLVSVYIPDSVTSIGSSIFVNCGDQVVMSVPEDSIAHEYAISKGYAVTLREPLPTVIYSGTCGEGLTWELYNTGLLVISGEGAMPDYNYQKYAADATPWSLYRDQIKKVSIGADVERIGSFAFYLCTNIEEVTFEENSSLTFIGDGAFGYIDALKSIVLPASLETIDKRAFYFSGLETVTFEENSNLKSIGNYAFRDCTSLVSVYIPNGVTSIGSSIFVYCGDQVVMSVPEDSIAHKYAISKGYAVTLREPLPTVIYSGTCGEGLTWELYNTGLLAISGEGAMPDYNYQKYAADATPWSLYRDRIKKVSIGAGVEKIGSFAFYLCTNIEEVTFEENSSLTFIGDGAFGYIDALKSIVLPASLETIDKRAFYFSGLETVAFEENSQLKTIGNYAFRDCTSLVSVYIPDSVTSIGSSIFVYCGDQVVANVVEGSYAHNYAVQKGYNVITR